MPRQPKPYFRKQTKSWYFSTGGKQIPLGKDREEAFDKFHELMLDRDNLAAELNTLYGMSQHYLDWLEKNRSEGTYQNQKRYLKSFIGHVGQRLKIRSLKNHHFTKWLEDKDWVSTSKNDAISIVLRMLNWAVNGGEKPWRWAETAGRRECVAPR